MSETIGIILSIIIYYAYAKNRSRKYKITLTVIIFVLIFITASVCGLLRIHDKWWAGLFFIPLATFLGVFISLMFVPYSIKEILREENIKDYYSTLNNNMKLFDLAKLDIPYSEFEKSIPLLKNILYAFSSSKDVTNQMFNYLYLIQLNEYNDINYVKGMINGMFDVFAEENKYLLQQLNEYSDIKRICFNLFMPVIYFQILEKKSDLFNIYGL
jgi:membrane-associated HD superfamily phosphohydrolase